jgi:hypothetical protein
MATIVEETYQRGLLFEKPMEASAKFCESAQAEQGKVVPMRLHARS